LLDWRLVTAPLRRSLLEPLLGTTLLLGRRTDTLEPLLEIPIFLVVSAGTGALWTLCVLFLSSLLPPSSCISMLNVRNFCLEFFFLKGFLKAASLPFLLFNLEAAKSRVAGLEVESPPSR